MSMKPSEKTPNTPEKVLDFIDSMIEHEKVIDDAGNFFTDEHVFLDDQDMEEYEFYKEAYFYLRDEMKKVFSSFATGGSLSMRSFKALTAEMENVFSYINHMKSSGEF